MSWDPIVTGAGAIPHVVISYCVTGVLSETGWTIPPTRQEPLRKGPHSGDPLIRLPFRAAA